MVWAGVDESAVWSWYWCLDEENGRACEGRRGGISLVFARTDTKAWQDYVLPYAKRILFLQGRLRFHTPDGLPGKDVANAPSALIAYTIDDALALSESGIPGWIVEPVKQLKG
jgi:hypothetical protein